MLEKQESSSISSYFNSLQVYPQLTHDELVELFKVYQKGGKEAVLARKKLTESNLRLVVYVAKKQKKHNIPLEDLIQEGNLGLLKAIERFDYKRGFRFSTYATWWIKQAISQYILKRKKMIRLPAHAATVQKKLIQAVDSYKEEMGREPTPEELSSLIDVSENLVKATIQSGKNIVSLQQTIDSDPNGSTFEERIEDDNMDHNPFEFLAKKEMLSIVKNVISDLNAKEIAILRLRFGLIDDLKESEYSVTPEELSQIASGNGLK